MISPKLTEIAEAAGARLLRLHSGAVMFQPGQPCRGFFAIRRGIIRVGMTGASGRQVILYRVCPGEICLQTFSCLVDSRVYTAEGIAQDAVEAFLLSPEGFYDLLGNNEQFRAAVLASIAHRLIDYERVVEALAFVGLEPRLATVLLRLADDNRLVFATHEMLAVEVGASREAVTRELGALARAGLISLSRGRITVKERTGLVRLAHAPQ